MSGPRISKLIRVAGTGIGCLVVSLGLVLGAMPVAAQDSDAELKALERSLGGINSRVVSNPKRAEEEYLRAASKLEAARETAPDHPSIPKIEKRMQGIAAKLEKRLGRPIGGVATASDEPTEPATPATPATPAKSGSTAAAAAGGGKLPGGVTSRLKAIDTALDKVDAALAGGDARALRSSERQLATAERKMREIHKNYGSKLPPDHPDVIAADQRVAKARTDLDAALASADAAAAKNRAAAAAERDARIAAQNRLSELRSAAFAANDADSVAGVRADFEAFKVAHAALFPANHEAVEDVEAVLAASEAKVGAESGSSGWIDTLRPFVASGSDRRVVASATANPNEMLARKSIYDEAIRTFERYRDAVFTAGKSPELERIEKELATALEAFPAEHARSLDMVLATVSDPLDQEQASLDKDRGWRDDPKVQPRIIDADRMASHRERLDAIRPAAGDDPRFADLEQKLAAIEAADAERRNVRAQRTFLRPDAFAEAGLEDIKVKAGAIVADEVTGSRVLRITVPSTEWKEEDVEEWTDTTKTAIRRRVTRSVTAEVAARQADGVFRHVLHVAKNKRRDGTWGQLYGHIMFTDRMAEANVDRDGP